MTMRSEIDEQPAVLERAIPAMDAAAGEVAAILRRPDVHHVLIAARGSSDNAARYAKYAWSALGGVVVTLAAPSLYGIYRFPPRLSGAAVVAMSQSGQSPDLIEVIDEGRRQERPTITITNDVSSPLAAAADLVVPIHAGEERSVAATKTYTATLAAVASIAAHLEGGTRRIDELAAVPATVAAVLARDDAGTAAERIGRLGRAVVLGRGYNHSTAFEWALKLQETVYVLAHPFSMADFAHGPFALLEPGFPVLAVATRGPTFEGNAEALSRIRDETGAQVVVITDGILPHDRITIPEGPEWLSPLPAIVAAQLFTVRAAELAGIDPDRPRGLTKVTRTT